MYMEFHVPTKHGYRHTFYLNFYESRKYNRYEVKDVCIIDVYKAHDHRYDLKAFFYEKKS